MKTGHDKKRLSEHLLTWYAENARELPWRQDASPYRVWVSEIMLQQTRVEAVKPYFERFMKELPTLAALAAASDDQLRKLWEGLGYYRRVQNMKACAQRCVEQYQGELPATYEQLLDLPGIGSYTAGAIASIAFHQPVPAVDGNVLRVFSRLLISEDDILKEKTKRKFQQIIQTYIPPKESAAFNQALMEIGALICVPNAAPRCNICPLREDCLGYQNGQAHRLPNRAAKKARRQEQMTVLVIVSSHGVRLRQRSQQGLLAGLYEFPHVEGYIDEATLRAYLHTTNIRSLHTLHAAKHIFSHVEWHMHGYLIEVDDIQDEDGIWCSRQALQDQYALPSAFRVYREALTAWWRCQDE